MMDNFFIYTYKNQTFKKIGIKAKIFLDIFFYLPLKCDFFLWKFETSFDVTNLTNDIVTINVP